MYTTTTVLATCTHILNFKLIHKHDTTSSLVNQPAERHICDVTRIALLFHSLQIMLCTPCAVCTTVHVPNKAHCDNKA